MVRFLFLMMLSSVFGDVFAKRNDHELVLEAGINSIVVMPNEHVTVIIGDDFDMTRHEWWLIKKTQHSYQINAPETPGFYRLELSHNSGVSSTLQVIVKTPIDTSQESALNNYQINTYPNAYKGLSQYAPPQGLIEINQADESVYLSNSVQIKNVMCKQAASYPKYLLVTTDGIKMLTRMKAFLNTQGIVFDKFSFISGYRTPYYNKLIGNGKHSRHLYGDAFDLFIDVDGDNKMDDLNGDGKQNRADVDTLYRLFVAFLKHDKRLGGVGKYYPSSRHGGFVHIDNRGFTARW